MSGAKAHGIGDAGYGIGFDRPGDARNVVAGLAAGFGDAGVKPVFGSNNDNDPAAEDDAHGASASFVSGSATFTAFASSNGDQDPMATRITAALASLSTRGDDARETDSQLRNLFAKARTGGWRHVHI